VTTTSDSPFNPTERMLRQFSGIWIVFFGAIAVWQELHHERHTLALALAVLAVTLGPLGLAWPRIMRPVFIGWMALVYPIGWTVSRLVLGLLFFGLFTPVAWVFRIMGRDELRLKPRPHATTYWQPKPRAGDKAQYLRQF
jgi:Saxitoxin biosynthesis operon protein SxtJ